MDKTDNDISLIGFIILILALIMILYFIRYELFPRNTQLKCPINFCATNLINGVKRCPNKNQLISYDPSIEVCNDPYGCTNSRTLCTYEDPTIGSICPGDINYSGICSEICNCVNTIICPDWATVYFTLSNNVFIQNTSWRTPLNTISTDYPLIPGETNAFCGLSDNNISKIWPPHTCLNGTLGKNKKDGLWYCMATNHYCVNEILYRDLDGTYYCA